MSDEREAWPDDDDESSGLTLGPYDGIAPARLAADGTPLVDPGSLPRLPYAASAKRERPLIDWQPIGPLAGHVTVTPITRHDRRGWFELQAAWGPNPDGTDVAGLGGTPTHRVTDILTVRDEHDARRLAGAAREQLAGATSQDPHTDREPAIDLTAIARRLGVELA